MTGAWAGSLMILMGESVTAPEKSGRTEENESLGKRAIGRAAQLGELVHCGMRKSRRWAYEFWINPN